ncbi:MAG TPA: hypothetical protein VGK73_00940 [Polyangiaceae bacterium]
MKSPPFLLSSALVLSLVPSLAWSAEPSLADWVKQRVHEGLVKPLAEKSPGRFSRGRPPPSERRVRALQATTSPDKQGRAFVPFAVDVRFGDTWREADILGCVYRGSGEIFVKIDDGYRPARFLLGKDAEPVTGACEAAPPRA